MGTMHRYSGCRNVLDADMREDGIELTDGRETGVPVSRYKQSVQSMDGGHWMILGTE